MGILSVVLGAISVVLVIGKSFTAFFIALVGLAGAAMQVMYRKKEGWNYKSAKAGLLLNATTIAVYLFMVL